MTKKSEELYVLARESKDGVTYSALRTWKSLQDWIDQQDMGGIIYHCYLTPFARTRTKVELLSASQGINVADSDPTESIAAGMGQVSTEDASPVKEAGEVSPVRTEKKAAPPAPKRRRRKRSRKLLPHDGGDSKE